MTKLICFFACCFFFSAYASYGAECEAYLTAEKIESDGSSIRFWHFQNDQWSKHREVYQSDDQWNYAPSMSFNDAGEMVFLWVSADENEFQIYSRTLDTDGAWKNPAFKLTQSVGQKSTPKLFLSLNNQLYAAWVSDESGADDIQLMTMDRKSAITRVGKLYEKNEVPDINPSFGYQVNERNEWVLTFNWEQLSKEHLSYLKKDVVLQKGTLAESTIELAAKCKDELNSIGFPKGVSSGTYYFPSLFSNSHIVSKQR